MKYKVCLKAGFLLTLIMFCLQAHAQFYRWVDENGRVHYSDKLPPKQTRQEHEKINKDGVSTKKIDRDKTDEERSAEREKAKVLAVERKRKAAEEARQRKKDQILLDSYLREQDLLDMRENRLSAVESQINLAKLDNDRQHKRLALDSETKERLTNASQAVPQNVLNSIVAAEKQIAKNDAYIESKQKEYARMDDEFAEELERYRELKGISSAPSEEATAKADN